MKQNLKNWLIKKNIHSFDSKVACDIVFLLISTDEENFDAFVVYLVRNGDQMSRMISVYSF